MATAVRGTVAGAVAAVTRTLSRRPSADAIVLLETDHRRVQDLLKRGEATSERATGERSRLLEALTAELRVHEAREEKVFYPALEAYPEAADLVRESLQEHHLANLTTNELIGVAPSDEQWAAKFKVLKENVEHHIGEEEGKMFRTARALFSQDELESMGAKMAAMKRRK